MQKTKLHLHLVSPAAAVTSLPALAAALVVLLLLAARRASLLDAYRSSFVSISRPGSGWLPPAAAAGRNSSSLAAARVPRGCDIFRGEWVPDDGGELPYYTNRTCAVIQEHQNCMKYGRPDLGFLRWRWRPAGCGLPRFDAAAFLDVVRDRSLAFVGDSLARNHMQSLMCLLSKVVYPKDVSKTTNQEFRTVYYERYNFTISIFWSPYLVTANQSDPGGGLWDLYLDEPDGAWLAGAAGADYVVVSAANWFTRPSMFHEAGRLVGCHYCLVPGVADLTLRYSLRAAFRTALRALSGGAAGFERTTVIVRTMSPTSHFEGGAWDRGGDCRRTRPYAANETAMAGLDLDFHRAQVEEFAAAAAAAAAAVGRRRRMMLMDTTAAMLVRPDGHPSRYGHWAHENVTLYNDCVHWCLPGPIDMWNEILFQLLLPPSPVLP